MNSYWIESSKEIDNLGKLEQDLETEVCIIGAGIFGLTTAYYLVQKGFKVTILEKYKIANKTTGHTTAKITSQHGIIYNYLIQTYGMEYAQKYLEANQQAIKNIKQIIDDEKIECNFNYQDNYIYTTKKDEVEEIKKEIEAVKSLGFEAEYVTETELPFEVEAAIKFKRQAMFHPLKYVAGLYNAIKEKGAEIFVDTPVFDIKKAGEYYEVVTEKNKVKAKYVVIASHYPFKNFPGIYFAKMYQSSSYIIGVDTKSKLFDGMYINPKSPIYSFRKVQADGKELLLLGGADHKTGEVIDYQNSYGILEKEAKKLYPNCEVLYRWSTRDCITLDKIPYIGQFSDIMKNVYIGTGFNKWGMTSSNVAANIICDEICGKTSEYKDVFTATRMNPIVNKDEVKNMVSEVVNSLIIKKMKSSELDLEDIENDKGGIVEIDGQKVGVYKDTSGNVFAVKPVCTHLGCELAWNDADKTWDCPCHGSRFDYIGKNIYDPAIKDLEKYDI